MLTQVQVVEPPYLTSAPEIPGETPGEIVTARGASVRFLKSGETPDTAAAVMLLAGDHGNLDIGADGKLQWGHSNFLVRTRHMFQQCNIATVLVDSPSDRKGSRGLYGFRADAVHAEDLATIASQIRRKLNVPVWLVGTSRGAESAVNAACRGSGEFAGMILVAAVTRSEPDTERLPGCVFDTPLADISVPCLLVHHVKDACPLSPCSDVPLMRRALRNSSAVEEYLFDGGAAPLSEPCRGLHAHGFFGIEKTVIEMMAKYIKKPTRITKGRDSSIT
jgi:pimeloyl-ACP methyl ester carboxylesterase